MNWSLDLGMMTNHRLLESTGQSPELSESTEHNSNREPRLAYWVTTWIKIRYYCTTQTQTIL
jgi:hypothetical protein